MKLYNNIIVLTYLTQHNIINNLSKKCAIQERNLSSKYIIELLNITNKLKYLTTLKHLGEIFI